MPTNVRNNPAGDSGNPVIREKAVTKKHLFWLYTKTYLNKTKWHQGFILASSHSAQNTTTMKKSIKVAIVAIMAIMPCSFVSAAQISSATLASVTPVVTAPANSQALTDLIAALKAEIKAQGLDNVASIASQVLAKANSNESAAVLAEAVTTAAFQVAKELQEDLLVVAADIGEGIAAGTSPDYLKSATDAAAATATTVADKEASDALVAAARGNGEQPTLTPSGDAGVTPSTDISTGTGVAK
jgi:hypothetical protein